jgi:RimJ/RimL family protein N-acetyltransferase
MLFGEKVRLRAIERSDIPTFLRWFNDPQVRHFLLMRLPMSQAGEERWFEKQLESKDIILGIETYDGVLIGNCGLHHLDDTSRNAEMGIVIGEQDYWGKGYGSDAIRTFLRFAFNELNLHRVYLHVHDYNARAIRCYEKCGFRLEGREREAHFHEGRYHDVLIMAILCNEFDKLKADR